MAREHFLLPEDERVRREDVPERMAVSFPITVIFVCVGGKIWVSRWGGGGRERGVETSTRSCHTPALLNPSCYTTPHQHRFSSSSSPARRPTSTCAAARSTTWSGMHACMRLVVCVWLHGREGRGGCVAYAYVLTLARLYVKRHTAGDKQSITFLPCPHTHTYTPFLSYSPTMQPRHDEAVWIVDQLERELPPSFYRTNTVEAVSKVRYDD